MGWKLWIVVVWQALAILFHTAEIAQKKMGIHGSYSVGFHGYLIIVGVLIIWLLATA